MGRKGGILLLGQLPTEWGRKGGIVLLGQLPTEWGRWGRWWKGSLFLVPLVGVIISVHRLLRRLGVVILFGSP